MKGYVQAPLVDLDHVEEVLGEVLENEEHLVLFLERLFNINDVLTFQHF